MCLTSNMHCNSKAITDMFVHEGLKLDFRKYVHKFALFFCRMRRKFVPKNICRTHLWAGPYFYLYPTSIIAPKKRLNQLRWSVNTDLCLERDSLLQRNLYVYPELTSVKRYHIRFIHLQQFRVCVYCGMPFEYLSFSAIPFLQNQWPLFCQSQILDPSRMHS